MTDKKMDNLVQISLFSDGDTKIDNTGKKIEKNVRDRALNLQKCEHIKQHHGCVYNLSEDETCVECQIEQIQKCQNGARIPPCTAKCGTKDCIYYTENNFKG